MPELTHSRRMEIQALLQELSDYWHDHSDETFVQVLEQHFPANRDFHEIQDYELHSRLKASNAQEGDD